RRGPPHIRPVERPKEDGRLAKLLKHGEQLRNADLHPSAKAKPKHNIFRMAPTNAKEEVDDWDVRSKDILEPALTGKYSIADGANHSGNATQQFTIEEAKEDCHMPEEGEACYVAVHWTRTEGLRKHPEWFTGVREPKML
ncbi:unnamed protein product, partial [Prorocentrum cordatum]